MIAIFKKCRYCLLLCVLKVGSNLRYPEKRYIRQWNYVSIAVFAPVFYDGIITIVTPRDTIGHSAVIMVLVLAKWLCSTVSITHLTGKYERIGHRVSFLNWWSILSRPIAQLWLFLYFRKKYVKSKVISLRVKHFCSWIPICLWANVFTFKKYLWVWQPVNVQRFRCFFYLSQAVIEFFTL